MLLRREVPRIGAEQADEQEDRADDHMRAVEAGRHEEGRAVDVAFVVERRVAVFVGLHAGEQRAEHDGADQAPLQAFAVVMQQRVVRPGHGRAGGQQDQRVEQRQVPRIERLDALRRPHAAEQLGARDVHGVGREQRGREIGPEPGDEEHHLGGDEQDHAVAVRDLHHAGVVALVLGLVDDVAPPGDHGVEHADRADREHQRRRGEHLVHPGDQPDREQEGRDRADDRPRARIDEVIVVVLGVRVGHRLFSVSSATLPEV